MLLLSVVALLVFLLGLVFGSFANAVVHRLKTKETLWARSACPHCHKKIFARDLMPVFSWIWLHGRCRACQRNISLQYPIVELLMGGLFVIAYLRHPFLFETQHLNTFLFEAGMSWSFFVIALYDLRWQLIPMQILWGSMGIVLAWQWILSPTSLEQALVGMVVGGSWMLVLFIISRGKWIGSGDIWLAMLVGLSLGWPLVLFSLYTTYVIAGLVAAALLIGRYRRVGQRLAFAPFLAIGVAGSWWFGSAALTRFLWFI